MEQGNKKPTRHCSADGREVLKMIQQEVEKLVFNIVIVVQNKNRIRQIH